MNQTQTNPQTETSPPQPNNLNSANSNSTNTNTSTHTNILEWSYSGKAMRAQFIFHLLISLLIIGGTSYAQFSANWIKDDMVMYFWIGIAIFLAIIWVKFYFTYFYRVLTIKYKLEENRLYSYKGFFTQQRDTLELMYINDIQLVRTLFDIMFNGGVGKLIIFSSIDQTDAKLVIVGVENPYKVVEIIDKTRTKLREQRAIIA
ncbi:MAG: PH domain-containing protein [Planctomycetaceae bacterium]|jgi:uncharacterized membrane protein YdbT with pleckstrin-like domain|nr:PH domain-containing protein [Planctomycetaceae bacterium]